MSLWESFGGQSSVKSSSSILSKASKVGGMGSFEGFEHIELVGSNLKKNVSAEVFPMPEALGAVNIERTPEDTGLDEFAAHVAQVQAAWPEGPPMTCQDVPNWEAFCLGWWRGCFHCPYYDGHPASSPCSLWEAAFPGVVRWYPIEN